MASYSRGVLHSSLTTSCPPLLPQPAVPNSDYEEIGNTKFSSLKASPPPRRSNHHKADDDDDEDLSEGVAYPGGKNAKFAVRLEVYMAVSWAVTPFTFFEIVGQSFHLYTFDFW